LSDGSVLYVPGVGQWDGQAWTYELPDGLGRLALSEAEGVRQLADSQGYLVQRYEYGPFGEMLASEGQRANSLRYTGEQWDSDVGLLYLRARWYDPATGRFTTRDPFPGFVGLPQTQNPYVYVNNNPTNLTDPSGKIAPLLIAAGVGAIIGGVASGVSYVLAHPCENYLQSGGFWRAVGVGALSGAAAGAVGFWVGGLAIGAGLSGSIAQGILTGVAASSVGQVVTNLFMPGANWYDGLLEASIFGGITGGIAGGAGYGVRQWLANGIDPIPSSTNPRGLRAAMGDPPPGMTNPQAHHDLPWEFRNWFAEARRGLDVNDPNFGRWVEGTPPGQHQNWSHAYSDAWRTFIENNPTADRWQVLDNLRQLLSSGRYQ
jgi:RHS repeat-associated protein